MALQGQLNDLSPVLQYLQRKLREDQEELVRSYDDWTNDMSTPLIDCYSFGLNDEQMQILNALEIVNLQQQQYSVELGKLCEEKMEQLIRND